MAKFRVGQIGELCRQMAFTPLDARLAQLVAAEALLGEIDAAKAYPFNFVVFRITGYRPRGVDETLLTGLALQHDLGLLIEQVSETLALAADKAGEPVLSIEEARQRFNVTSKTVQRWRRRGLAARRFIFPDGKRRIGFLLGTVERFLAAHCDQAVQTANCAQLSEQETQEIVRRARRLAIDGRCCVDEINRRIGRRLRRSPLTIAQVLRAHDLRRPDAAVLPLAAPPLTEQSRIEILRARRRGASLASVARRLDRPRSAVARVIIEERLARFGRRRIRFIDDPLYHQPDAAAVIEQIVAQQELTPRSSPEEQRIPRDLPPYLRDLYRTPLLSPAQERALFLKLNFHKFQLVTARRQIEPQFARARDLNALEGLRRQVAHAKNQIVRANLRLVVSVARKHLRPGLSLMELISDGNMTLMRAVDSFDLHRGFRFSTYATLALMKGFARGVPLLQDAIRRASSGQELLASVPDGRHSGDHDRMLHRDHVQNLLLRLEPRERDVLRAHYGLSEGGPATYRQLGARMGLSKQRVRQIEQAAIAKLRGHLD